MAKKATTEGASISQNGTKRDNKRPTKKQVDTNTNGQKGIQKGTKTIRGTTKKVPNDANNKIKAEKAKGKRTLTGI